MTGLREAEDGGPAWRWCREPGLAEAVAGFFVAHADPAYISHSELQGGRAAAPGRWAEDLHATVLAEARRAIRGAGAAPVGSRLAVLERDAALRGIAFVSFAAAARRPFAVLDDLLIDAAARGEGAGRSLLDWLVPQCRAGGFSRLFLESGLGNGPAHRFFERHGFVQTSLVMMRVL